MTTLRIVVQSPMSGRITRAVTVHPQKRGVSVVDDVYGATWGVDLDDALGALMGCGGWTLVRIIDTKETAT